VDFNANEDEGMYSSPTEVEASLQELMFHQRSVGRRQEEDQAADEGSEGKDQAKDKKEDNEELESYKDLMALYFTKAINTMRQILLHEIAQPLVYQRYLVLHADQLSFANTSRLLIRCKMLLEGRKLLSQILMVIIERNKLIDSLK